MIRVLLCDDHLIVREGIRELLADAGDVVIACEAENGADAVQRVHDEAAAGRALHVVLMDIAMPHRDGLDVLRRLKADYPKLAVLMLSTYPDKQYAVRSLKLGASGYLNKSADSAQMIGAIRKVAAGGLFFTPTVAGQLATSIVAGPGHAAYAPLHEQLSERECQVLRLLAGGREVSEIADRLVLPSSAVRSCRARILEKTGARNDVELALFAARHELAPM